MNMLKKYPVYRKFVLDNIISTLGDGMYYIALMTYASQFENSGLAIMIVSMSEAIPNLFYAITGGVADVSNQRAKKVMVCGAFRGILYGIVGLLIGFPSSMKLLAGIGILNFFSDISGKYANGLLTPFVPLIVEEKDLEKAQGFSGALTQLSAILANFIGAFLIGLFSYKILAYINSATFFVTILIIYSIKTTLDALEKKNFTYHEKVTIHDTLKQVLNSLKELYENKSLFRILCAFAVANGELTVISPLVSMFFAKNPTLVIQNFSLTIAFVQGSIAVGAVLGGLFGPKVCKNVSLPTMCQLIFFSLFLFASSLVFKSPLSIVSSSGLVGLVIGATTPKLTVAIIKETPLEKLGAVSGGMNTLLLSIPPVSTFFFTTIANVFSLHFSSILFGGIAIAALIFMIFNKKQEKNMLK